MTTPLYNRAPSEELKALFSPGGFLEHLLELTERRVAGLGLDVHLRRNDEVHVYCGLTRILKVNSNADGTVGISADQTYEKQDCAKAVMRRWNTDRPRLFREELDIYLDAVKVPERYVSNEGRVQYEWSRVAHPWVQFDREAVLEAETARAMKYDQVDAAHAELSRQKDWSKEVPAYRAGQGEIDQLAVDPEGRLVLVELKSASANPDSVYYSPLQLLRYIWMWHASLETVLIGAQDLIDARVEVGLTSSPVPALSGGLRAAIGFGRDTRSAEVKHRFNMALSVVNEYLPLDVPPIETWALNDQLEPTQLRES